MQRAFVAAAILFLSPGIALAQSATEASEARQSATLVPRAWLPPSVHRVAERDAAGRRYIVRQLPGDVFEIDYGDGHVRVNEDGRVLGRD